MIKCFQNGSSPSKRANHAPPSSITTSAITASTKTITKTASITASTRSWSINPSITF